MLKHKGDKSDLMAAANRGDLQRVKELISKGVDVNTIDQERGATALIYSAAKGHAACVEALVAAGADMNIRTHNGSTALICAASRGAANCLQVLINAGADINAMPHNNRLSPLMHAAAEGHLACIHILLKEGADVTTISRSSKHFKDMTALMIADKNGNSDCANAIAAHIALRKNTDNELIRAIVVGGVQLLEKILSQYGEYISLECLNHALSEFRVIAQENGIKLADIIGTLEGGIKQYYGSVSYSKIFFAKLAYPFKANMPQKLGIDEEIPLLGSKPSAKII